MGKGIQITNTVILGLITIPLTFIALSILMIAFTSDQFQGLNSTAIITLLTWITSIIYFFFLTSSFKKCNIENKSFKWAFWLNIIWISLAIILFVGSFVYLSTLSQGNLIGNINEINSVNNLFDIFEPILGTIYFISFIVFMFGYFKNKNN